MFNIYLNAPPPPSHLHHSSTSPTTPSPNSIMKLCYLFFKNWHVLTNRFWVAETFKYQPNKPSCAWKCKKTNSFQPVSPPPTAMNPLWGLNPRHLRRRFEPWQKQHRLQLKIVEHISSSNHRFLCLCQLYVVILCTISFRRIIPLFGYLGIWRQNLSGNRASRTWTRNIDDNEFDYATKKNSGYYIWS